MTTAEILMSVGTLALAVLTFILVSQARRENSTVICLLFGCDTGGCCMENVRTGECTAYCCRRRCHKQFKGTLGNFITENVGAHERLSGNVREQGIAGLFDESGK